MKATKLIFLLTTVLNFVPMMLAFEVFTMEIELIQNNSLTWNIKWGLTTSEGVSDHDKRYTNCGDFYLLKKPFKQTLTCKNNVDFRTDFMYYDDKGKFQFIYLIQDKIFYLCLLLIDEIESTKNKCSSLIQNY